MPSCDQQAAQHPADSSIRCHGDRCRQHTRGSFTRCRSLITALLSLHSCHTSSHCIIPLQARVAGAPSTASQASAACQPHQAEQQDTVSVDSLYRLIGEPRGPCKAKLHPHTADQVRCLHSRQLQEAAAAEAATVGTWQQLPHQRLLQPSPPDCSMPCGASVQAVAQKQSGAGQCALLPPPAGVQQSELNDADVMQRTTGEGSSSAARSSNGQQPQEAPGPTEEHQHQLQQQQQAPRSPLMHHAAIMHFAALRAAAVGQSQPGS